MPPRGQKNQYMLINKSIKTTIFFFFIFSPRSHKLSYDDNDGLALLQIEAHSSNVVKALGQTHSVSKLFREHFYHGPFDLIHWLQYSARSISQFPECPSEMNKLILTELNNFEFEENDGSEVYGEKKRRRRRKKSAAEASNHVHDCGESSASVSFPFQTTKREMQFSAISQTMTDTFKSTTDERHRDDGTRRQFSKTVLWHKGLHNIYNMI